MTAERTSRATIQQAIDESAPCGQAARALADRYLRYVSAVWRGDPEGQAFGVWLSPFWRGRLPPAPPGTPDAVSPHGGGGRGLRWYETPDAVLGCVPGLRCGYYVPKAACAATPPVARSGVRFDDGGLRALRRRA